MMEQDYRAFQALSAQRYLQTALVIDDEAELLGTGEIATTRLVATPPGESPFGAVPMTAPETSDDSVASGDGSSDGDEKRKRQEQSVRSKGDDKPEQPEQNDEDEGGESGLNFKALADGFLSLQIICTAYRPAANEKLVEMSANAAVRADIVIVDWFLRGKNAERAKEVVKEIVTRDRAAGGRLRLIAIYTSQTGLEKVRDQLYDYLSQSPELAAAFSKDNLSLRSRDTHIAFFNKAGGIKSAGANVVAENELPSRLITEFASLSKGLLSTFALNSVAALRDAANHIVSLFKPELDGAYVSHHCGQNHPIDALSFAIDFITNELRNVLAVNDVAENSLGEEKLKGWASALGADHVFNNHLGKRVDRASIDKYISDGASAKSSVQQIDAPPPEQNGVPVGPKNIINTFFSSVAKANESADAFSRLTSFKREAHGASSFPEHWRPVLTLGTVLRRIEEKKAEVAGAEGAFLKPSEKASGEAVSNGGRKSTEFLVCVQPRCDSVRLGNEVYAFPFQSADRAESKFNLIVRTSDCKDFRVCVNLKPRDTWMHNFTPDKVSKRVEAFRDANGHFAFVSTSGEKFEWLGDLTDMKAQHFASTIGGRVHGVGFDEFEWLRLKAE
jgi:Response receiver domain